MEMEMEMVSISEREGEIGNENEIGTQYFSKGSVIEVSSNENGFRGSFFIATIIKVPSQISPSSSKKHKKRGRNYMKYEFLVEYKTLVTEDLSKPLREYKDLASMRPLPPTVNEEDVSFSLNDIVDAHHEEGWWIGVITNVLEESKRYSVFFSDPPHVIDFDPSDLRVHFDWVDGKWVRPTKQQQEVLSALVCQKQLGYANNSADKPEDALLESSSAAKKSAEVITQCQREKSTSDNENSRLCVAYSTKKRMNQAIPKTDAAHSHPSKKLKERSIDTPVVVSAVKSGTVPVKMVHEAAVSVSTTPTMGGIGIVCSKVLGVRNQPSAKTEIGCAEIIQHNQCRIPKKKRGRRGRRPKSSGEVCNGVGGASGEMVVKDCTSSGVRVPVMAEAESTTTGGFQCENTNQLTGMICNEVGGAADEMVIKDYTSTGVGVPIIAEVEFTTTGGFDPENTNQVTGKICNGVGGTADEMVAKDCTSTCVRVPIIAEVESTSTGDFQRENTNQLTSKKCDGVGDAADEMVIKDCTSTVVGVPIIAEVESTTGSFERENTNQLTGKICNGVGGTAEEMVVKDYISTEVGVSIIKEVEPTTTMGFQCENSNQLTGNVCNEVGGAARGTVINVCTSTEVELPLPTTVESTTTGASQRENSPCRTVNQLNEARERKVETAIQEAAMDTPSDSEPDDNQSLPFVKSLPVWREIDSLEVFQNMPQKPHFHPLHSQEEVWREGLAIARMVTFANVVEMTSNLKFDDPKSNFDRISEVLPDLEIHGFDVEVIRNHLNQLLSIKANREEFGVKVKEIESWIMERTHEKTHMEKEINEVNKTIKDLEEKRAILLSTKEDKDSEIVRLRSSVDVICEGIQNALHEFERVASAFR